MEECAMQRWWIVERCCSVALLVAEKRDEDWSDGVKQCWRGCCAGDEMESIASWCCPKLRIRMAGQVCPCWYKRRWYGSERL